MTTVRFLRMVGICLLSFGLSGGPLAAQDNTAASIIAELGQRQTALNCINGIEQAAARIVYVESIALLSEHGEWPEELAEWPEGWVPKFLYDVNNISTRFRTDLANLRRTAARSGVFTEDEHARVQEMFAGMEQLIDGSQDLYALLERGQLAEANAYFRDNTRALYQDITAGTYTVASGISRDISRAAMLARTLN